MNTYRTIPIKMETDRQTESSATDRRTDSSGSSSPAGSTTVRIEGSPSPPHSVQTIDLQTRQQPYGVRKMSINNISEKIVTMLDEIERRVEILRETASLMEDEKAKLLGMLDAVLSNGEGLDAAPGEKEDILATASRLVSRCRTVDVQVKTLRNEDQVQALHACNTSIDACIKRMQDDVDTAHQRCRSFLNACSPDQPDGPIDVSFQNAVIACTADDQKKIRRRLEQLSQQIESAQTFAHQVSYF